MNKKGANEKTEPQTSTPTVAKPTPTLTAEQKLVIVMAQRDAVLAQSQKQTADQQYEKAMAALNKIYQDTIGQNPGFTLNADTLELVSTQQ